MTLRSSLLPAALLATAFALAVPVAASGAAPVKPGARRSADVKAFAAQAATATRYRPGEIVVRYGATGAHAARAAAVPRTKVLKVRDVAAAERKLRKQPGVLSVTRNYVARVSGWI